MPSAPPIADTSRTLRHHLRRLGARGLRVLAIGLLISIVMSLLSARNRAASLVYGVSITMLCWFFIDSGRLLAAAWLHRGKPAGSDPSGGNWPGWGWMLGVIVAGTAIGYSLGIAFGNWATGLAQPGLLRGDWRHSLGMLTFSLVPGFFLTYLFYSRALLAKTEARAEAAQREAAENQLKLLQSQLEPHMLFNTLANLRVLIGLDPPRAQLMLDRLIAFLRATLSASRATMHPLSAEFARVADYLALMQVRMGDRLQPRLELPPALADLPVPPLLLQPLVENAIKHGLEPHVDGGRLVVAAVRDGERLVLTVRDTGAGLGPPSAAAPAPDSTRFGLQQVRERLAALYGDAARFELSAAADAQGGSVATVQLPIAPPATGAPP